MPSLFTKLATPPGDVALLVKTLQGMRNAEELARNAPATVVLGQVVALLTHMRAGLAPAARKVAKRMKGEGVRGEAGEHSFEAVIGKVGGKPVISRIMVWKGAAKPDNLVADFSGGLMLKGEVDPLAALLAEFAKKYPQLSAPMKKQGEEEDEEPGEAEEPAEGETPSDGDTVHAVIFALAEMLATAGDPLASQVLAAYDAGDGKEEPEEEELEGQEDEAAEGELEEEPMAASARPTMRKALRVRLKTEINDEAGETGVVLRAGTVVDVIKGKLGSELLVRVPDGDDVLPVSPGEYEVVKGVVSSMRKALVSGGYAAAKYLVDATGAIQKAQMQISGEDMPPEINQELETARTAIQSARTAILAQVDARKGARPTMRKGEDKMPSRNILRGTIRETVAKAARAPMRKATGRLLNESEIGVVRRVLRDNGLGMERAKPRSTPQGSAIDVRGVPDDPKAAANAVIEALGGDAAATFYPPGLGNEGGSTLLVAILTPEGDDADMMLAARATARKRTGQRRPIRKASDSVRIKSGTLKVEEFSSGYALMGVSADTGEEVEIAWLGDGVDWLQNPEYESDETGEAPMFLSPGSPEFDQALKNWDLESDSDLQEAYGFELVDEKAARPGMRKAGNTVTADEIKRVLTSGPSKNKQQASGKVGRYAWDVVLTPEHFEMGKQTYGVRVEVESNEGDGDVYVSDSPYAGLDFALEEAADAINQMIAGIESGDDGYEAAAKPKLKKRAGQRRPVKKAAPAKLRKQTDEDDEVEEDLSDFEGFNDDGYRKDGETVVIDPDADLDDVGHALIMEGWEDERADESSDMGWSYSLVLGKFRVAGGGDEYAGFIYGENKNSGNKAVEWFETEKEARAKWKGVEADVASEDAAIITEGANGVYDKFREWFSENPDAEDPQDAVDDLQDEIGDDLGTGTSDAAVAAMLEVATEVFNEMKGSEGEGGEELEAAARIGNLRKLAATEPSPAIRAAYEAEIARLEDGIEVQKGGGPDVRVRKFEGFSVGDQVMHKSYGQGRVMALETGQAGRQVSVVFSDPEKGNLLGPLNIDPRKLKLGK